MFEASTVTLDALRSDCSLARRTANGSLVGSMRVRETDEVSVGVFSVELNNLEETCNEEV
jgi:hypothetical protein